MALAKKFIFTGYAMSIFFTFEEAITSKVLDLFETFTHYFFILMLS